MESSIKCIVITVPNVIIAIVTTVGNDIFALCNCGNDVTAVMTVVITVFPK